MKVSEQIIDVIDALCEKLGVVIDWSADNILPYVQELCQKFIRFEIATSIFWIVLCVVLCAIGWTIVLCTAKRAKKHDWDYEYLVVNFCTGAIIVSCVLSLIAISVTGAQVYDIVEAKVFPEKVIYDYLSNYLR